MQQLITIIATDEVNSFNIGILGTIISTGFNQNIMQKHSWWLQH